MHNRVSILATLLALLVIAGIGIAACSGTSTPSSPSSAPSSSAGKTSGAGTTSGGTTSGTTGGGTGTLTVQMTDSPFTDAKALLVTFSEVSVHTADPGDWTTLPFAGTPPPPWVTCDLTQLKNTPDILGLGSLSAGHYTQIRLNVTSATLYFDYPSTGTPCLPIVPVPSGKTASVDIPSGEVKLNREFTVGPNGATKILLDFNADQSVHATGGGNGHGNSATKYIMNPVIGIVSVQQ